jgi:hypothetical protein
MSGTSWKRDLLDLSPNRKFYVSSMMNGKDGVSTFGHYVCGVWL